MPVCEMVYGARCQMQLHNLSFDESGANISQILQKNDDYAENIAPSIASQSVRRRVWAALMLPPKERRRPSPPRFMGRNGAPQR